MVKPSTAFAVLVACAAGLVVVNDADVALPEARSGALPVALTIDAGLLERVDHAGVAAEADLCRRQQRAARC